jgi:hypothetical protein
MKILASLGVCGHYFITPMGAFKNSSVLGRIAGWTGYPVPDPVNLVYPVKKYAERFAAKKQGEPS